MTRYCETIVSGANESLPLPNHGCVPRCEPASPPDLPWRIRRTHRNIDRYQTHPYRAVHTPGLHVTGARWCPPRSDMEIPVADTCTGTSCRSESVYCRGRSSITLHTR